MNITDLSNKQIKKIRIKTRQEMMRRNILAGEVSLRILKSGMPRKDLLKMVCEKVGYESDTESESEFESESESEFEFEFEQAEKITCEC